MHDSDHPGKHFHEASKNRYHPERKETPWSEWPEEWKKIYYKNYPRFNTHLLPTPNTQTDFAALVSKRKSERQYNKAGLSQQTLSDLLFCSCGKLLEQNNEERRVYASGGARYPIETYIIVRRTNDTILTPGVYHYNVKNHALEYLWKESTEQLPLTISNWAQEADALLVMTAVFSRSINKYRERGYRFAYIDAGAILQNLYLFAASRGDIKVTGYSGTNDDVIEELLRLNTDQESLIISALIGS